jgi:hypothetical protein
MSHYNKEVGFNTYLELQRVETLAADFGFKFNRPRHHGYESDYISLCVKDNDALPIYTRDSQLYTGTLGEISAFLTGLKWARDYDRMLKLSDSKKRERKEQDERNRQLTAILKAT